MAVIPHVFKDAGLTETFDDAVDTLAAAAINGASGTGTFYVGSTNAAIKIQAASDPGVDAIEVSISDASPGGGVEATHIKLAATEAALSSATGGAALNIGDTINGGEVNAVPVWFQWDNSTGSGTSTEISLGLTARVEVAL